MDIFQSKKLSDIKNLTPLQISTLKTQNIENIGELLQIVPRKLDTIEVWSSKIEPNQKYKHVFELRQITHRKSSRGQPYIMLHLADGSKLYQAFLFARANFLLNKLKVGSQFGFVVSLFGSLGFDPRNLVIHKVLLDSKNTSLDYLDNSNLELFYPKTGAKMDTAFFRRVHSRLLPKDYILDLSALVPLQLIGSHELDLSSLHHPKTQSEFFQSLNQLQTIKVFLKTAVEKYIVYTTTKNNVAFTPKLDLEWLQESVKKLPVVLTASQKGAIWEILQDTTITK